MTVPTAPRPLSALAADVRRDWKPVHPAAVPYLNALATLNSVDDNYGADTGLSVVAYFLSNARSWRGDTAKRVKAELKALAGLK